MHDTISMILETLSCSREGCLLGSRLGEEGDLCGHVHSVPAMQSGRCAKDEGKRKRRELLSTKAALAATGPVNLTTNQVSRCQWELCRPPPPHPYFGGSPTATALPGPDRSKPSRSYVPLTHYWDDSAQEPAISLTLDLTIIEDARLSSNRGPQIL